MDVEELQNPQIHDGRSRFVTKCARILLPNIKCAHHLSTSVNWHLVPPPLHPLFLSPNFNSPNFNSFRGGFSDHSMKVLCIIVELCYQGPYSIVKGIKCNHLAILIFTLHSFYLPGASFLSPPSRQCGRV